MIVDFSDTTFIDSTTLGVLVGGVKRLRTNDGQLSLVCSDRNITKIFEITGLDRVFTIYGTRDEACRARVRSLRVALRGLSPPRGRWSPPSAAGAARSALVEEGDGDATRQGTLHRRSAAAATRSRTPARRARSARTSTTRSACARSTGFDESTIRDVVRGQIAYPVDEPTAGGAGMPADLVTGEDADAVAAYVAAVAGLPVQRSQADGGDARRRRAAARRPTARRSSPRRAAAAATRSPQPARPARRPEPRRREAVEGPRDERVTNGMGAMPPFKDVSAEQINAVADYVATSAGK